MKQAISFPFPFSSLFSFSSLCRSFFLIQLLFGGLLQLIILVTVQKQRCGQQPSRRPLSMAPAGTAAASVNRVLTRQLMRTPVAVSPSPMGPLQRLHMASRGFRALPRLLSNRSTGHCPSRSPFPRQNQQPNVKTSPARRPYSSSTPPGSQPQSQQQSSSSSPPPPPPPPPPKDSSKGFKIWPFLVLIALGSGSYVLLVKQRAGRLSHCNT